MTSGIRNREGRLADRLRQRRRFLCHAGEAARQAAAFGAEKRLAGGRDVVAARADDQVRNTLVVFVAVVEAIQLFRWQQRRFRSTVLLREGQPKEAALRAALDLARDGAIRSLTEELEAISPHDLAAATSGLEAPRVLVIGPRLGDGGVDPGR